MRGPERGNRWWVGLEVAVVVASLLVGSGAVALVVQREGQTAEMIQAAQLRAGCAEYVLSRVHETDVARAAWLTPEGRRQMFQACLQAERQRVNGPAAGRDP